MQLVVHSTFGSRVNRAWGLALRKRFCQRFDFELQAAATDDAIVLSLGVTHSFPLEEVFQYLRAESARELLVQAVLVAPMFGTRFRWNANRALAVLRFRGGKRVPPRLQRMDSEDLISVVFPDQVACQDNLTGPREVPDPPRVKQTLSDCLVEAMDIEGFEALLASITGGEKRLVARDTTEASPFSHGVLTARPYAFLDDAPLEERRTQAVYTRRFLDPRAASELGALDASAIARVRAEAWPAPSNADELSEALTLLGYVTLAEGRASGFAPLFEELRAAGRATVVTLGTGVVLWVAAERFAEVRAAFRDLHSSPELSLPPRYSAVLDPEKALLELLRGRLEALGPVAASGLAESAAVPLIRVTEALGTLESEGFVLRGRFTPGQEQLEWCERRLLARIHRYTLGRLRSEIEPVTQVDYLRFLFGWHRLTPETQGRGPDSLAAALSRLEGFEAPAAAWEAEILPSRVLDYDPAWLDAACLSGKLTWFRRSLPAIRVARSSGPARTTPIVIVARKNAAAFRQGEAPPNTPEPLGLSPEGERVHAHLQERGACFFDDIVRGSGLSAEQAELTLAELVASRMVTSDAFAGLRALITPASARARELGQKRRGGPCAMDAAGRWSLLPSLEAAPAFGDAESIEAVGQTLLRRYGIVFRRVVEREAAVPPWRDLVRLFRRLEACGDIRGGRFVDGFSGEQYALPEAVEAVRAARRAPRSGALVSVSGADPANLVGIVTPGERVPAIASNRVLYRDGLPVARKVGDDVHVLVEADSAEKLALESALLCRPPPLRVRLRPA
jgi:ATP-dependent Lhr-like helicase